MLSRRSFIQASLSAAGGLAIAAFAPEFAGATTLAGEPWSPETGRATDEVNAFVVIDPDNSISLRVAKSEMGQGVLTSLAMIVAEELECDFAKVKVEYASAHRNLPDNNVYQSMGTGGSLVGAPFAGVPAAGGRLGPRAAHRRGGGEMGRRARRLRRRAAASSAMRPPARSATFGELAADAAKVALAAEPAIKTPDQFKLIGQGMKRLDTPLKVTGAARFGIDTRLPGMVYAAAANCPVFGGKLKSYDFSAISGRRGIIAAVPVTNGVAVVADNFWRAKEALAAMPIEWDFGPAASTDSARVRRRISRRARWAARRRRRPWRRRRGLRRARRRWSRRSTRFRISRMRRWSRSTRPPIGARTASTSGWARKTPIRRSRSRPRRAASTRARSSSTIASSAAASAGARSTTN